MLTQFVSRGTHRRPRSSPVTAPAKRHIAPLDGLRGLAVLGVLFFHAGRFGGGFLGVDLFFVLSGFLITGLLLKEAAANGGAIDLVAFWGRRVRRLLPALAAVAGGTLTLVWIFGPPTLLRFALDDSPWVMANLANWHFIIDKVGYWDSGGYHVFSHLWSIAVEEQFYLVWPLLLWLLVRARQGHRYVAAVAGTGALVSLGLMIALISPTDTTRVYEGTDTRAFSLLLGALVVTRPLRQLLARVDSRASGSVCAALAAGLATYGFLANGQNAPSLFHGGLFLHALACALLIALLAQNPGCSVGRLLGSAPLRGLGLVSYSLYLWHWPIYLLLSEERLGFGAWPRTGLLITVSVAAAVLSKVLVEDPIRFKARWATGRTGLIAFAGTLAALALLWLLVPRPDLGAGTVDITRLTSK